MTRARQHFAAPLLAATLFALAGAQAHGQQSYSTPGQAEVLVNGRYLPHPVPASQGWVNPRIPGVQAGGWDGAPRDGGRPHTGNDNPAPYGAPVYANAPGIVTQSHADGGNHYGYGNQVRIVDAYGNEHLNGHLAGSNQPLPGQYVEAGQQIGNVGRTGNVTAMPQTSSHLHYEVRRPDATTPANPHGRVPVQSIRSNDLPAGHENYINSAPNSTYPGAGTNHPQAPRFTTDESAPQPQQTYYNDDAPRVQVPSTGVRQSGTNSPTASLESPF